MQVLPPFIQVVKTSSLFIRMVADAEISLPLAETLA